MDEKVEELTAKEHTFLVLKYGTSYAERLFSKSRSGVNLSELEKKAAIVGEQLLKSREEEAARAMSNNICKEIDEQILRILHNKAMRRGKYN